MIMHTMCVIDVSFEKISQAFVTVVSQKYRTINIDIIMVRILSFNNTYYTDH
jgi:poly(A) polymerase Pap1